MSEYSKRELDPESISHPANVSGAELLHQQNPKLHTSKHVELEKIRREKQEKITSEKPAIKIDQWLQVLRRIYGGHGSEKRQAAQPQVLERIKRSYHKEYVIKPEDIPENVFGLEQRIAREQGHGNVPITDQYRQEKTEEIISAQEASMDKWMDYLTGRDAVVYPMWAKYWAFTSVMKMGKLEKVTSLAPDGNEKESVRFGKRDDSTAAPFPTINPRALALTIGVMQERLEQRGMPKTKRIPIENQSRMLVDEEFKELANSESFSRIYAQFLSEQPEYSAEGLKETRGVWRKYEQGSEANELVDSIQGYPLEWCTADFGIAQSQLEKGDFYVYYSIDENNNPVIPRVAIRMDGDEIGEVRGIASNQNMDPYIDEVVAKKMEEFPDGQDYIKKSRDMERLTDIDERFKLGLDLTKDDLRFIYELDGLIKGFGYERDPRISEIIEARNSLKSDIAYVLGISFDEVCTNRIAFYEATVPIKYFYGTLDLSHLSSAEGLTLPQSVGGDLNLRFLTSAEGLTLPESVGGSLDLYYLTSAEDLTFPQSVGGTLDLNYITSAEGLTLPQSVGGGIYLESLTSEDKQKLRELRPDLADKIVGI